MFTHSLHTRLSLSKHTSNVQLIKQGQGSVKQWTYRIKNTILKRLIRLQSFGTQPFCWKSHNTLDFRQTHCTLFALMVSPYRSKKSKYWDKTREITKDQCNPDRGKYSRCGNCRRQCSSRHTMGESWQRNESTALLSAQLRRQIHFRIWIHWSWQTCKSQRTSTSVTGCKQRQCEVVREWTKAKLTTWEETFAPHLVDYLVGMHERGAKVENLITDLAQSVVTCHTHRSTPLAEFQLTTLRRWLPCQYRVHIPSLPTHSPAIVARKLGLCTFSSSWALDSVVFQLPSWCRSSPPRSSGQQWNQFPKAGWCSHNLPKISYPESEWSSALLSAVWVFPVMTVVIVNFQLQHK